MAILYFALKFNGCEQHKIKLTYFHSATAKESIALRPETVLVVCNPHQSILSSVRIVAWVLQQHCSARPH